jgi:hypothetical protein
MKPEALAALSITTPKIARNNRIESKEKRCQRAISSTESSYSTFTVNHSIPLNQMPTRRH